MLPCTSVCLSRLEYHSSEDAAMTTLHLQSKRSRECQNMKRVLFSFRSYTLKEIATRGVGFNVAKAMKGKARKFGPHFQNLRRTLLISGDFFPISQRKIILGVLFFFSASILSSHCSLGNSNSQLAKTVLIKKKGPPRLCGRN